MRVKFLDKIRVVLLFVTISVIIGVSRSRKFASQGTCGKWDKPDNCLARGMKYYQHPVKGCESLGFCDCYQGYRMDGDCDSPVRMQIYMPERNRCYPIFSQGPCKRREWLIFDEKHLIGKCVANPCFRHGIGKNMGYQFWFYDPRIGRCLQASTNGHCPNSKELTVVHDSPYPQCMERRAPCRAAVGGFLQTVECLPGSRYSHLLKKCRIFLGRPKNIG